MKPGAPALGRAEPGHGLDNRVTVNVAHQGKTASFNVTVELPSGGSGTYPAIIGLSSGFFGFPLNADLIKREGVAIINFDPYTLASETGSRGSVHSAALASAEVYEALGAEDNISYHSAVADGVTADGAASGRNR